jgi:3-oxoacyl-[acyl-carrier-protein] synthase-1
MAGEHAWICGIGMITPVGGHTAQTAASVRAGISVYADSAVYKKRFEPMTMALIPEDILPPLSKKLAEASNMTSRQSRMLRIAHLALQEVLESLPKSHTKPLPLLMAGPEPLPGRDQVIKGNFLRYLETQADIKFDSQLCKLTPTGRAGGMQALKFAQQVLVSGEHDYILVGGVDSYLDLYLLAKLDAESRILANGVMDGFAPGEGAAFLLLCSDRARESMKMKPQVKIHCPGIAKENGHRYSEEPYTGDGLAQAFSLALSEMNGKPVASILSSINGENFGAKEWGVAYMRNSNAFEPESRLEHPAECFGDTGAAATPILAGLVAVGMEKGYRRGPALVWCSSEGPLRGAVCISLESAS